MPYLIQYFVNSLGRDAASCSDLMSYLLFTPKYTRELIQLGYQDAHNRIDEIEEYLFGSDSKSSSAPRNGKSREVEPASRRSAATASFLTGDRCHRPRFETVGAGSALPALTIQLSPTTMRLGMVLHGTDRQCRELKAEDPPGL